MERPITATAYIGTHCPHCAAVLAHLNILIKEGELAELNIINLHASDPMLARQHNIRSVPVVRISEHELAGNQTIEALRQRSTWAKEKDV